MALIAPWGLSNEKRNFVRQRPFEVLPLIRIIYYSGNEAVLSAGSGQERSKSLFNKKMRKTAKKGPRRDTERARPSPSPPPLAESGQARARSKHDEEKAEREANLIARALEHASKPGIKTKKRALSAHAHPCIIVQKCS